MTQINKKMSCFCCRFHKPTGFGGGNRRRTLPSSTEEEF